MLFQMFFLMVIMIRLLDGFVSRSLVYLIGFNRFRYVRKIEKKITENVWYKSIWSIVMKFSDGITFESHFFQSLCLTLNLSLRHYNRIGNTSIGALPIKWYSLYLKVLKLYSRIIIYDTVFKFSDYLLYLIARTIIFIVHWIARL